MPLRLYGQELQAESYAVAHMNAIIHDMDVRIERGDTMINPKFKDAAGRIADKGDWAWLQHTLAGLNERGRQ